MTERTIILHIGLPKTGTTAIQKYLMDHAQALEDSGILFPTDDEFFTQWNHVPLAAVLTDPFPSWVNERYRVPPESVYGRLRERIDRSDAERVVLSSEQFSLAQRLGTIRDLLDGFAFRVVFYVRWQHSFLESWFRQSIVSGGSFRQLTEQDLRDFLTYYEDQLDYHSYAEGLAADFGRQQVEVRLFEREALRGRDAVSDFLSGLDLTPDELGGPPATHARISNQAVSGDLIELKALANESSKWGDDLQRLRRFSVDVFSLLQRFGSGAPSYSAQVAACFTDEFQRELLARFEESNRRLVRDYLDDAIALPQPRPGAPEDGNGFDLERLASVWVSTWQMLDDREQALRKRVGDLEQELEILRSVPQADSAS